MLEAIQPKTRELDGLMFRVGMLPSKTARAVLVRAARILGPALGELGKGATGKGVLDVGTTIAAGALSKLTEQLGEDDLEYFVEAFKRCTSVQWGAAWVPLLEEMFAGRPMLCMKWLAFAFETNFADFLAVALATSSRQSTAASAASPSESPRG